MAILGGLLGGIGGMGQDWWKRLGGGAQSLAQLPQDDEWARAAMQAGGMQQQEPVATRQGGGLLGGIFNGGKVNFNDLGGRFAQAGAMMSGEWDSAANIAQNRAQLQGLRAKQMAEADQQQRTVAALQERGYSPAEIQLLLSGALSNEDLRPKPQQPDEFQRMTERAGIQAGSQEYQDLARRKVMGDPFLTGAPLPNGGSYYGYASGLQGVLGSSQQSDLTPMTPEEIQKHGLSAGGPSQPATGGFRRYRR